MKNSYLPGICTISHVLLQAKKKHSCLSLTFFSCYTEYSNVLSAAELLCSSDVILVVVNSSLELSGFSLNQKKNGVSGWRRAPTPKNFATLPEGV